MYVYPARLVTVCGPVGVGAALEVEVVGTVTVTLPLAEAEAVVEVAALEGTLTTVLFFIYRFNLAVPPQYVLASPAQVILHPVTEALLPGIRVDPLLRVLPQKHSPEYSTPK
jgi:hypothetical protein